LASIERRRGRNGKTVYRARARLRGHEPVSATFNRKTDAVRWAQDTEAGIRQGRHFPGSTARTKTLSDLIERFRTEELPRIPKMKALLVAQLRWWEETLGSRFLADVTPAALSEGLSKLKRTGRGRGRGKAKGSISNSTVNRYLTAISLVMGRAVEWGWVELNPALRVKKLKEPRGRTRYLSDSERGRLLSVCRELDGGSLSGCGPVSFNRRPEDGDHGPPLAPS
jgi:hypothetical protein